MSKTLKLAKSLRRQYTQVRKLRIENGFYTQFPRNAMRQARLEMRKGV